MWSCSAKNQSHNLNISLAKIEIRRSYYRFKQTIYLSTAVADWLPCSIYRACLLAVLYLIHIPMLIAANGIFLRICNQELSSTFLFVFFAVVFVTLPAIVIYYIPEKPFTSTLNRVLTNLLEVMPAMVKYLSV